MQFTDSSLANRVRDGRALRQLLRLRPWLLSSLSRRRKLSLSKSNSRSNLVKISSVKGLSLDFSSNHLSHTTILHLINVLVLKGFHRALASLECHMALLLPDGIPLPAKASHIHLRGSSTHLRATNSQLGP